MDEKLRFFLLISYKLIWKIQFHYFIVILLRGRKLSLVHKIEIWLIFLYEPLLDPLLQNTFVDFSIQCPRYFIKENNRVFKKMAIFVFV